MSKPHFDSFINKRNKIVHSDGAFVKVRDLMSEYGLNRDQVYRRIKCYKIPSKKVGGIQFICKKSFDDVVKPLIYNENDKSFAQNQEYLKWKVKSLFGFLHSYFYGWWQKDS